MGGLSEYQIKHCPYGLDCEDWKICSKCSNGKVYEAQFAGQRVRCTLKATIPKVFTAIGRDKGEIIKALPSIKKEMKKGFNRGHINDVYWNMDEDVPSYFTLDYDSIKIKK